MSRPVFFSSTCVKVYWIDVEIWRKIYFWYVWANKIGFMGFISYLIYHMIKFSFVFNNIQLFSLGNDQCFTLKISTFTISVTPLTEVVNYLTVMYMKPELEVPKNTE